MFVRLFFVGVCTDVKRAGVQGHCRTNSLVDHLLETRQKHDTSAKKKERETNVGGGSLVRNSKVKERERLSGLNDYLTSLNHTQALTHTQITKNGIILPINIKDMHMMLHRMEVM